MVEWEKNYLDALLKALHPFGDVLQVGFPNATLADAVQAYRPARHTILTAAAEKAKDWAKNHPSVKVLEGAWQDVLPRLGVFDSVFFDDPVLRQPRENLHEAARAGSLAVKEGKKLIERIKEEFPQLTKTRYTDRDIEEFYQTAGRFQLDRLPYFFAELRQNGQITEEQYVRVLDRYGLSAMSIKPTGGMDFPDPLLPFLEECIEKHMRKGSRFSCYLVGSASKYEDSHFSDGIITNPKVEYREEIFKQGEKEALIIVVEKVAEY